MKGKHSAAALLLPAILTLCMLCGCTFRPVDNETAADPERQNTSAIAGDTASGQKFTITYLLDGAVIGEEIVAEGNRAQNIPSMADNCALISWENANGTEVDLLNYVPLSDMTFSAVRGPALRTDEPCIAAREDGLFHGKDSFTRSDAVRAVYTLLDTKPTGETFLKDVTTRALCYPAASSLASEGYITLDAEGKFHPDVPITVKELSDLLGHVFSPAEVARALPTEQEELTREEAAAVFSALLGAPTAENTPYFPDVSPSSAYYAVISAVGIPEDIAFDTAEGFRQVDGYLYYMDSTGYYLCDSMKNTLYFGSDGRYTSGSTELDTLTAEIIAANTDASMSREEMLRALYNYVRDHYLYLKRNIYEVGHTGWELEDALTMFTTGKGNCYNFTAAFWALSRGIGYDTVAYAGLVGHNMDPHSWNEIELDGIVYVFDVETEMSYLLDPDGWHPDCWKMDEEAAAVFSYIHTQEEADAAASSEE